MPHGGLAPLTSMYFFGPERARNAIEDFRPEVHDSDGLMILNGHGEELWRPLNNPKNASGERFRRSEPAQLWPRAASAGLCHLSGSWNPITRNVPSLVVEPIGDWGEGEVVLFEIPTDEEIHDNIAAFWRPKAPAGRQERISLHLSPALGTRPRQVRRSGAVHPYAASEPKALTRGCSCWSSPATG